MQVKLDEYDRRILLELFMNSREATTQIAKKVKLSRENVNYRIKRLENQGIIREYNTYFNESLLGLKRFVFWMQLVNLKGETESEIMHFLRNHKGVTWLGPAAGKWSVIFDVVVTNNKKVSDIMKSFFSRYENNIGEYVVLHAEEERTYFYKVIKNKLGILRKNKSSKSKLDDIDKIVMSELNKDARISYVSMSQKTSLTANAVKKRVKNLEKSGIITNYTLSIDIRKLGFEWYTLNLALTKFSEETETKLKSFFAEHDKVIFYCRNNGTWDYDVGIFARNSVELREFINALRSKFAEEVKIVDVFVILEEIKGYKLPDGVFE